MVNLFSDYGQRLKFTVGLWFELITLSILSNVEQNNANVTVIAIIVLLVSSYEEGQTLKLLEIMPYS